MSPPEEYSSAEGPTPELSSERIRRLATGIVAGFVHDLNSSFASISLFLDLVEESLDEEDREMAKKVRQTLDELAAREEHLHWIGLEMESESAASRSRSVDLGILVDAVIRLWRREHPEREVEWVNVGASVAVPGRPLVLLSALDDLVAALLAPPAAAAVGIEVGEEEEESNGEPRATITLRRSLVGDEAERPGVPVRSSDLEPVRQAVAVHGGRLELRRDDRELEAEILLPR